MLVACKGGKRDAERKGGSGPGGRDRMPSDPTAQRVSPTANASPRPASLPAPRPPDTPRRIPSTAGSPSARV
ncbi:hypothetical protein GCM10010345_47790 [Streptomyces canarius]|uniref:Uncharacterized protein n=1 Tax=Streptomyces canarius TaxID=285453 RepID=A0ABQ3CQ58_9ACTN|nr:hypothetical protein GCM10010345_47790 [Streptomyces canarius]